MKRIFLLTLVFGTGCLGLNAQTSWSATSLDGNTYRNGNVGIGISTPNSWFTGKTLEMYDNRPILKLNSSDQLSTILFTNAQVNTSTHYGEFHFNHRYNETDPTLSTLSINSYPTPSILYLRSDGNVGIGTGSPEYKLDVNGTFRVRNGHQGRIDIGHWAHYFDFTDNTYPKIRLRTWNQAISGQDKAEIQLLKEDGSDYIKLTTIGTSYFLGNLAIGTVLSSNPNNYKLAVDGIIGAKEIKVEAQSWSDFVFHPTYNLRPLQEVNTYIQQNGHLPEIPTAKEVEENGISLGEMNAKLLQKIEELTLYVIEQQREIEELKNQNKKVFKLLEVE